MEGSGTILELPKKQEEKSPSPQLAGLAGNTVQFDEKPPQEFTPTLSKTGLAKSIRSMGKSNSVIAPSGSNTDVLNSLTASRAELLQKHTSFRSVLNRNISGGVRESMGSYNSIDRPIIGLYPRKSILVSSKDGKIMGSVRSSGLVSSTELSGSKMLHMRSVVSLRRSSTRQREPEKAAKPEGTMNAEYNEYLMLQNRHSSSNYIQQLTSMDLIWESKPLPVKMIGTHLKGGQIGKGAFSKVKEGICNETLQRVAIKIVSKKRVKKMMTNIVTEIKLLRRLKHINIVTLVDVFAKVEDEEGRTGVFAWFESIEEEPLVWMFEDGTEEERMCKILKWYIVLEFCSCSLQAIIDHAPDKKIPIPDAQRYFIQLINGLEYLHSQCVIHRDIKPGNLMITVDGVLKITDFGIAEQFDPFNGQQLHCEGYAGTHQFVAPEVFTENPDCTFDGTKVDIWASGIVLYYMVFGRLPFDYEDEPNVMQLQEKISNCSINWTSEVPDLCCDLLKRILDKNPATRLTCSKILKHPWILAYYPQPPLSQIVTYLHSQTDITKEDTVVPCETTMLPFISKLYEEELSKELEGRGFISDMISNDENDKVFKS